MKIILSDKTEMSPLLVSGDKRFTQGANRDTLTFIFNGNLSLNDVDNKFTSENCETIRIIEDNGNEYIHTGYTIRSELSKKSIEVSPATEATEAIYEDRITISMAQRTYAESQLASLTDTVDTLVMESLLS